MHEIHIEVQQLAPDKVPCQACEPASSDEELRFAVVHLRVGGGFTKQTMSLCHSCRQHVALGLMGEG